MFVPDPRKRKGKQTAKLNFHINRNMKIEKFSRD